MILLTLSAGGWFAGKEFVSPKQIFECYSTLSKCIYSPLLTVNDGNNQDDIRTCFPTGIDRL